MSLTVAEVKGVHPIQQIALTSCDVLEQHSREALFRGEKTTVVTFHTNERPKRLPEGTIHVGAAFEDRADFDEDGLRDHLRKMAAYVWAADTPRVLFICQAGVNRSSLGLLYYCARHGNASWQEAKAALVAAKAGAARGWPTLENAAFEAFLARRFPPAERAQGGAAAAPQPPQQSVERIKPRWFSRTVATARPSTGGKGSRGAAEAASQAAEQMRNRGVDPRTGRTYGCWEGGQAGRGVWVRGMPQRARPWEGEGSAPLGEGVEPASLA